MCFYIFFPRDTIQERTCIHIRTQTLTHIQTRASAHGTEENSIGLLTFGARPGDGWGTSQWTRSMTIELRAPVGCSEIKHYFERGF